MKNIDKIMLFVNFILSIALHGQYVESSKIPPKIENIIGVIIINDAVLYNEDNFKSMINFQGGDTKLALANYWGPFFALGLKNYSMYTYNKPSFIGTFETNAFLSINVGNVNVAIPKDDFVASYPDYDFYLIIYRIATNNGERKIEKWYHSGGGGVFMPGFSYQQVYREPYLSAKADYTIYKLKSKKIIDHGTTAGMVQCGDKISENGDIGSLFSDMFSNGSTNEYGMAPGYTTVDKYRAWNLLPQELIANIFKK